MPIYEKPYPQKENMNIRRDLRKVKTGTSIGVATGWRNNLLIHNFGCEVCSWRDTNVCPHGLKAPETHTNKYCTERINYAHELWEATGTKTRFFQQDHLIKLFLIDEKLQKEFRKTGELPKSYHQISRNIITLLDKMRRQDEGIKIQMEGDITINRFKEVVEAQAKIINGDYEDITDADRKDTKKV